MSVADAIQEIDYDGVYVGDQDNDKVSRNYETLDDRVVEDEAIGMVIQEVEITADGSSGINFTVLKSMKLMDIVLRSKATSGSGTMTLRRVTTAISDAIVCAVDLTIGRAGTLSDLGVDLVAGETLNIITAGANDRGVVRLIGYRT